MQTTTLRNISPQFHANLIQNDYSELARKLERRNVSTSFQPFYNFRAEISIGGVPFSTQTFSIRQEKGIDYLQNHPTNSFPQIQIILRKENSSILVEGFTMRSSDNSIKSEISTTRLLFLIAENKGFSLFIEGLDAPLLEFDFEDVSAQSRNKIFYHAGLFRKLGFIESVFRTKFSLPEEISAEEIERVEMLFRGLTEGEFSHHVNSSINLFNYKLTVEDFETVNLKTRRNFIFDEDMLVLDKFFPIGKVLAKINAAIANPRVLKNRQVGDVLPSLRLNVFDSQIIYRFDKYCNPQTLLRNKQKLEQFKNVLRKNNEPDFLVSLLDERLGEIKEKTAIQTVTGYLQFYDFPDRFSVLNPTLEGNFWRVPIALIYPKQEPIWLEDALVDAKTGEVELGITIEELKQKGKLKAKEIFSSV